VSTRRVAVLFGGRSGEHEISLRSAWAITGALRAGGHTVLPVGITTEGRWQTGPNLLDAVEARQRDLRPLPAMGDEVRVTSRDGTAVLVPTVGAGEEPFDVVFPVLHGTFGEDGTVQGLFEMAGVPYVGAGVLASALSMDKALAKAVLRDAGIPVCRWLVAWPGRERPDDVAGRVAREIGFPCFVKPANMGSSVGITKVGGPADLAAALDEAVAWDPKVVVEEAVRCREFECGVTGNDAPAASVIGELMPSREFYDYYDKYVGGSTTVAIPAAIPGEMAETMRRLAVDTFRAVDCEGLARVDFFLDRDSDGVYVNEINTMPGFTAASMFPKLWEATGVPFPDLVARLVELGIERHRVRAARRLSFSPPTTQ
jgi:D-alanine-D-alanine ligase